MRDHAHSMIKANAVRRMFAVFWDGSSFPPICALAHKADRKAFLSASVSLLSARVGAQVELS